MINNGYTDGALLPPVPTYYDTDGYSLKLECTNCTDGFQYTFTDYTTNVQTLLAWNAVYVSSLQPTFYRVTIDNMLIEQQWNRHYLFVNYVQAMNLSVSYRQTVPITLDHAGSWIGVSSVPHFVSALIFTARFLPPPMLFTIYLLNEIP